MIRGRMEQQLQFGLLVQGMKIEAGDLDVIRFLLLLFTIENIYR